MVKNVEHIHNPESTEILGTLVELIPNKIYTILSSRGDGIHYGLKTDKNVATNVKSIKVPKNTTNPMNTMYISSVNLVPSSSA